MSNGVFNFNFLALVFSEILGGPKFTLGGPTPHGRPLAEKFFIQSEYFTISNCVSNFNITLGGPVSPVRPLAEKFLYPRRVLYYV